MFPNGGALGRRIRSWRDENLYREIVGVVADHRYDGLTDDVPNNVFVPHTQNTWRSLTLVVRSAGDPNQLLGPIRAAIWSVDKKLPVADVSTLEQIIDLNMARPRFAMLLLTIFGLTAVLLAAGGTYGVIAHAVTQRTREIGIRMALGAVKVQVIGMVVVNALGLAVAGVLCGLACAFALTRLVGSLLVRGEPHRPVDLLQRQPWCCCSSALPRPGFPARRASRVDPASTLRYE